MDALIGATLVLVYAVALAGLLLLFRCSHDGLWIFPFAKPGSRVVSHAFDMGDWKPDKQVSVDGRTVYLWTVPKRKDSSRIK